jgi:hypothetical protein
VKTLEQLTTRTFRSYQSSSRNGVKVKRAQLHHGATTSAINMRDMMVSGSRQVSANRICTVDGEFWDIVDASLRAWTSADAAYDRESFTVETQNLSTNGWTISRASHEALAQLCAALSVKYGWGRLNRSGPFSTWNVVGHREIFQFLGRSYATACPGGMDLEWIVKRGNEILDGRDSIDTPPVVIIKKEDIDIMDAETRSYFDNRFGRIEGRIDTLEEKANDGLQDHDNIGNHVTRISNEAEARIIDVTTREGKGARAYQCIITRRTVVISEKGQWWRDFTNAANPVAEVDQLAAQGWCQKDIQMRTKEDFEYLARNANRTFLQANPLPYTLTGEKPPAPPTAGGVLS